MADDQPPGGNTELREDPRFAELCRRLGAHLRDVREQAGLTQEQAAARLGLSARHVQDLEAGRKQVTALVLFRYELVFGVNFDVR